MGKKRAPAIVIGDVETRDLSYPKLQEFAVVLLQKLDHVRKDRNFLQVQCSQLRTAWELARTKLEESKCLIRSASLRQDNLPSAEGYDDQVKIIHDESVYHKYDNQMKLIRLDNEAVRDLNNLNQTWDNEILLKIKDEKKKLIAKNKEDFEECSRRKEEFDRRINESLDALAKRMEEETMECYRKEQARREKNLDYLQLMTENSLFKVQEEYNRIFSLMKEYGDTHFSVLKTFYQKILDDDVSMILLMKKEVNRLSEALSEKKIHTETLKTQIENLKKSKGKLQTTLKLLQNKLKLHRVKTSFCEKGEAKIIHLSNEAKTMNSKYVEQYAAFEKLQTQELILSKLIEDGVEQAYERRKESFNALSHKLNDLQALVAELEVNISAAIEEADPLIKWRALEKFRELQSTSVATIGPIVLKIARQSKAHDETVDLANEHLKKKSFPLRFQKIDFKPLTTNMYNQLHKINSK